MLRKATILLAIFCLVSLGATHAQNKSNFINKTAKILDVSGNDISTITQTRPTIMGKTTVFPDVHVSDLTFGFVGFGLLSGYDLQSNGTPDEIWQDPANGDNLHAMYMQSQVAVTPWADRTCTYFSSNDGGLTWNNLVNIPTSGEKSGYPSINGFDDGTEIITVHSNAGGGLTRSEIFIDAGPGGQGDFSMCDPGTVTDGEPIWGRIVGIGTTDYVFSSSINLAPHDDAFINTGNSSCDFTGYVSYPGSQAETYSLAYDDSTGTIGHLYIGNGNSGDVFYRSSTDGTVTWSDPDTLWKWNSVDSMGALRGCDLTFFNHQPYAVLEIDKIGGTSYFPAFPSVIYLWSPAVNGGVPMVIADSNSVPYGINYNSANDVTTPICRPTIGVSHGALNNDAIFVAFMAATDQYMGDPNGTANTFYAGYFTYSADSGKTFTAPVKFTPDTPLRDWRYVSLSQENLVVNDSVCTVHMVMQSDTIPGSTVNNTDLSYPALVSAQLNGINTTVTIPQRSTVGVKNESNKLYTFNLAQNYPNPFNPTTRINYSIPERSNVTLKIYNMLGQEVATLVNSQQEVGSHSINFDASKLASGLYIYKIQAGNFTQSKKMMLLK